MSTYQITWILLDLIHGLFTEILFVVFPHNTRINFAHVNRHLSNSVRSVSVTYIHTDVRTVRNSVCLYYKKKKAQAFVDRVSCKCAVILNVPTPSEAALVAGLCIIKTTVSILSLICLVSASAFSSSFCQWLCIVTQNTCKHMHTLAQTLFVTWTHILMSMFTFVLEISSKKLGAFSVSLFYSINTHTHAYSYTHRGLWSTTGRSHFS